MSWCSGTTYKRKEGCLLMAALMAATLETEVIAGPGDIFGLLTIHSELSPSSLAKI
jgi:hypothetical protein